jgi:hypothetical protein
VIAEEESVVYAELVARGAGVNRVAGDSKTGSFVPLEEPCTVKTPPEGVPAVPTPTTVALRFEAVACVTAVVEVVSRTACRFVPVG